MTFATEQIKTNSRKITLVELDIPSIPNYFINYSSGIWLVNFNRNLGQTGSITEIDDDGVIGFWEVENELIELHRIGSLTVDDEYYTKVTSIALCDTIDKSWYYDASNYFLYIHFENYEWPLKKVVRIGIIEGFADKHDETYKGYYDDIYYETRLTNIPSLKKIKDALFFGILRYSGGNISLNNMDGYFDDFKDKNLFGQPIRIYVGYEGLSFSEFRQVHSGYIEDFKISRNSFDVNVQDIRKTLSRKIPIRYFTLEGFPYLSDNLINIVKPLAWGGPLYNVPLPCINSNIPSVAGVIYQFYICDTKDNPIISVSNVYLNGIIIPLPDWSLNDNIISIVKGVSVSPESEDPIFIEDNLDGVTADFTANSIQHGLDVLTDVLNIYATIPYNIIFYNTAEWAIALSESRDIAIYITDEIEINELIEMICIAEDGIFIVQDDGRFTFRKYDPLRTINRTIYSDEWLNEPIEQYKSAEYLSSVKIGYSRNFDKDIYQYILNKDYEDTAFKKYKKYSEKSYDTVLADAVNAGLKSETMMTQSKDIVPTVSRKTKTQNIDIEIMDFIQAEHSRESDPSKIWATYEIVGIDKNLNNYEINLDMRWIENIMWPDELMAIEYCCSGILTEGIYYDYNNSSGDDAPVDYNHYSDDYYGNDFYTPSGIYESPWVDKFSFTITSFGNIYFTYQTDVSFSWSTEVLATSMISFVPPVCNKMRFRFIYKPSLFDEIIYFKIARA